MAQGQALPENDSQNLIFGGVRFNDGELSVTYGFGTPLGGPVILIESVDAGKTGNWANTFMAAFPVWKSLSIGVLGGPEVDWGTRAEDDDSPLAYLVGAVGGMVSYEFGPLGICAVGKYRDDLKSSTAYEDGSEFGLALYTWF
jgi:hypothetical protein